MGALHRRALHPGSEPPKAPAYWRVLRKINPRYDLHLESIRYIDRKWRNKLTESDHELRKQQEEFSCGAAGMLQLMEIAHQLVLAQTGKAVHDWISGHRSSNSRGDE